MSGFFKKLFSRGPDRTNDAAPQPEPEVPAAAAPEPEPEPEPEIAHTPDPVPQPQPRGSWFGRLKDGLAKSSRSLTGSISAIFTKRKLDQATLEELEDALIQADLGVETTGRIIKAVSAGRYDKEIEPEEVKTILAGEVAKVLKPVEVPFNFGTQKPFVVLVVGVNGAGKTTTIGKLGAIAAREGHSVVLAACDTFRAAAIEQLTVWGKRIGAKVISRPTGADAAGLAFDAMKEAKTDGADILFIDTAGRLQNKANLMAELDKVVRVIKKQDETAPHAVCAGARCHYWSECDLAGRRLHQGRGRHRTHHDQARRHCARRHPGRHRRAFQASHPCHRRRRGRSRICSPSTPRRSPAR